MQSPRIQVLRDENLQTKSEALRLNPFYLMFGRNLVGEP